MILFRLELLTTVSVTYLVCVMCVPANEQSSFSIYDWFQNFRTFFDQNNPSVYYETEKPKRSIHGPSSWPNKQFKIVWNVPSFQCHKFGLNFFFLTKYGITVNYGDTFRGDKIALLYDPGLFPALLAANEDSDLVKRNGGVPQEGNLTLHLDIFAHQVENKLIPDKDFVGVGIIDFEHWRPIWSENFGTLTPYRKESRSIEKARHPYYNNGEVEREAAKRFEKSAWQYFHKTLAIAKKLRPKALWGYYGFPLCFNYTPKNQQASCSSSVMENNERLRWLFEESTAIYPSLYYKKYGMNENTRAAFMKGRIDEAIRVSLRSQTQSPVYPYTWLKYYDTKDFVDRNDLVNSLVIPRKEGAAGVIIWGASNDVNTQQKCQALDEYTKKVLGPIALRFLQSQKEDVYSLYETSNSSSAEPVTNVAVNLANGIDNFVPPL